MKNLAPEPAGPYTHLKYRAIVAPHCTEGLYGVLQCRLQTEYLE